LICQNEGAVEEISQRRWGSDERRQELLDAARRMIGRRGTGASMEDLAAEAGITKPVLYRYFGDRAGLYLALAQSWQREVVAGAIPMLRTTTDPRAQVEILVANYMDHMVAEQSLFVTLLVEPTIYLNVSVELLGDLFTQLAPGLGAAVEAGGRPLDSALPMLIGGIGTLHAMMLWWISTSGCTRDELVAMMVQQVWGGVSQWLSDPVSAQLA
jgi:AcrR family transcriptional regulator